MLLLKGAFFIFLFGGFLLGFFLQTINYSVSNDVTFLKMSIATFGIGFLEIFGVGVFLLLTYTLLEAFIYNVNFYSSYHYGLTAFWLILGAVLFYLLPGLLYMNSLLFMTRLIASEWGELALLLPTFTPTDFIVLAMEGGDKAPEKLSSMGDHTVVAGPCDDQNYMCANISRMITTNLPWPAKVAANVGKTVLGIPDVVCVGLDPAKKPDAT